MAYLAEKCYSLMAMRYAIIADIHGNLEALTAVLGEIEKGGGADGYWCLGDIVGYGPDPGACIDLLRRYNPVCVAGNHDRAVIGKLDLAYFNPFGATAARWTTEQLTAEQTASLERLPLSLEVGDFLFTHGSPADHLLEYVLSVSIAEKNFSYFGQRFCLVAHTHTPMAFRMENGLCTPIPLTPGIGLMLGESRMIINPGSVGQPRDGDPRASYAVMDTEGGVLRLHRISYD
ncbi:MAG: metallophosphatase family protein, partial [Dehalococcoidales bacterium]|nr:metallophosphatase family protein [Dehalococcoidales bacterium]